LRFCFFPKILESNVAIIISFQCGALRIRDPTRTSRPARHAARYELCNLFASAEVVLFHQYVLVSSEKSRSPFQRDPIDQLETFLVSLFDQLLRVTFQPAAGVPSAANI
jgi:hypothetical protein